MKVEERTPLAWPDGWARTKSPTASAFSKHTIPAAVDFVVAELKRLGSTDCILTVNGFLRSQPKDVGVAVYFGLQGQKKVLACDRWTAIACNLWAIGKHIEALRGQHRWGVGTLDQAFAGYTALPEKCPQLDWWDVLGVGPDATPERIKDAFRQKAKLFHPDANKGGGSGQMVAINAAYEQGLALRGLGK